MARFSQHRGLVKIFVRARNGDERLIAAIKAGSSRAEVGPGEAVRLYDFGNGHSYIRYSVGCVGPQGHWFAESALDVVRAFQQAGITPPRIRQRHLMGRVIAPFLANTPQADAAPAQRIG